MPVIFGPADALIPSGYDQPPLILAFGTLNTGDSVTWSLTGSSRVASNPQAAFHFELWTRDRTLGPLVLIQPPFGAAFSHTFTATGPTTFQVELYQGGIAQPSPTGNVFGATVSTSIVSTAPCVYGTEKQPAAVLVQQLTPSFVQALLARFGASWLFVALAGVIWSFIDVEELCGVGPPPLPSIDPSPSNWSIGDQLQVIKALVWADFCRCKDGTPAPTPPPPPVMPPNPGMPGAPVFPCDNVDPCAALVAIQQQLAALAQVMGQDLGITTLLQRYRLPFAYVPGAIHSNVSVTQSFPVSRLVGVKVSVLTAPTSSPRFDGLPTYITDLGWLSLVTADGMIDEIRLTRQEQSWFPALMPLAVGFGLTLREGVSVTWQELEAEP